VVYIDRPSARMQETRNILKRIDSGKAPPLDKAHKNRVKTTERKISFMAVSCVVVEFDTVLLLFNLQARIAELEEELEAERASRSKVSSYL